LTTALLTCGLLGAAPASRPVVLEPLESLANQVSQKAGDRSVTLVLRPDAGSSLETPGAVAGIREAVLAALKNKGVAVSTSQAADAMLRDSATAGAPVMATIVPVLKQTKTDLILYGSLHRGGDLHKMSFSLIDEHGVESQLAVSVNKKSIDASGDDLDLADSAISNAIGSAAGKMVEPVKSAEIKTVLLAIRPPAGDAAPAAFDMAIHDAISRIMHKEKIELKPLTGPIPSGTLQPSIVAKLKDLPGDSAVMLISYARRPGGDLVTLSIVSAKTKLAAESVGVDSWDLAVMPAIPVLNSRVLAFSESKKNTKVGNGECWTLAAEALKSAKAKSANGYTFGRKLEPGEAIYPGDIMQFTEAKFAGKTKGGGTWWMTLGSPNHTAVVRQVLGPTKYEILQQNPGPVKAATIDFKDMKSGKWEAWRPEAK
jgi:hypothetical protein